jgi:hypothetical protein
MSSLQALLQTEKEKKTGITFQNMKDIMSGERAYKIQIEGEKKCGKTRFCLSILNHLYFEKGLSPEKILFVWIDLDNGLVPLIEQKLIPDNLIGCIDYHLCENFGEVLDATDKGIKKLREHIEKYGPAGAWLIIDNMGKAWEGARDFYSQSVYGKEMKQLVMEAKVRALERAASKTGKKSGTIPAQEFDRLTDYGIINPLHNDWADEIKNSNINFIWTAHLKYEETEVKGNSKTVISRGEGQKHNPARVDFIIRKKLDDNRYLSDLLGSRYTSNLFTNIEDMDFTDFVGLVDKTMAIETKKRNKEWEDKIKERNKKFGVDSSFELAKTEKEDSIEKLETLESSSPKNGKLPTLTEVLHAEQDENGEIKEDEVWKF